MDSFVLGASGLEPQLAIPVIVVVVGALLVYFFGFQQTKEPSYEHLAILQSSSSYKNRSVSSNQKQTKTTTSAPSKPKANGHVVQDKERNGVIKKVVKTEVNKENKPPQVKVQVKKEKVKAPASAKPEDFESGEWIQAVSRKTKDKKPKKVNKDDTTSQEPSSPSRQQNKVEKVVEDSPPVKAPRIEDLLEQMKVLKEASDAQKQNHSTQTSPEKKVTPPMKETSTDSSTPKKQAAKATEVKPVAETKKEIVKENSAPAPTKVAEVKEEAKQADPIKSNIAFDEMGGGDTWEEAKSRGAKKRRTRKD